MRNRRNLKGAKRPDTEIIKKWVDGQQLTTSLGVVRKFPGETSHFDIDTENGLNEILIDVELIPSGERVLCRLGFGGDQIYSIPRVNSEVAVLIPYSPSSLIKDSLDYEPIIVGVLNTNAASQLTNTDQIVLGDNAQDHSLKGETYRSAEDSLLSAMNSLASALATNAAALAAATPTLTGSPAQITAYTASVTAVSTALNSLTSAITTFNTNASSYLTTKVKVE